MSQHKRTSIMLQTKYRLGILTKTNGNMMMVSITDKKSGETLSGELNLDQILYALGNTLLKRETGQFYRMKMEFYKETNRDEVKKAD